jgi:hypothetical protein
MSDARNVDEIDKIVTGMRDMAINAMASFTVRAVVRVDPAELLALLSNHGYLKEERDNFMEQISAYRKSEAYFTAQAVMERENKFIAERDAERDALKARVAALEKAAVTAIIPLEAMNLVGLDDRFPPEVAKGIREGIEAVRAALAKLDADQPKGNAHDNDIEKVARAIAGSADNWYGNEHHHLQAAARTIEVLMEPSDAMIDAGVEHRLKTTISGDNNWADDTRLLLQTMLLAILNEAPETQKPPAGQEGATGQRRA